MIFNFEGSFWGKIDTFNKLKQILKTFENKQEKPKIKIQFLRKIRFWSNRFYFFAVIQKIITVGTHNF